MEFDNEIIKKVAENLLGENKRTFNKSEAEALIRSHGIEEINRIDELSKLIKKVFVAVNFWNSVRWERSFQKEDLFQILNKKIGEDLAQISMNFLLYRINVNSSDTRAAEIKIVPFVPKNAKPTTWDLVADGYRKAIKELFEDP